MLGSVTDQSAEERWLRLLIGIELPVELVVVPVVPVVPVVAVVLVVLVVAVVDVELVVEVDEPMGV